MQLYPAIDLREGRCVRLTQGDFDRETSYGDDPAGQARRFADAGAKWIHVVDLDAARTGEAHNLDHIAAICAAVDVPVQSGGGVRDRAKAEALFAAGVQRVVVGTAAMENPALVGELARAHPDRVAVGLDARLVTDAAGVGVWRVATRGWQTDSGRDLLEAASEFEGLGVAALIVTEIGRDGTMEGPDYDGLTRVLEKTSLEVIASGGVGSLADVKQLARLQTGWRRLSGAIIGRALYEGAFTLSDALAVVEDATA